MKRFIVLIMVVITFTACTATADIVNKAYDGHFLTAYTPEQWALKENDAAFAAIAYYDVLLKLINDNKTLEINNFNEVIQDCTENDGFYVGHDKGIYCLMVVSPTSYVLISYYPDTNHLTYTRQDNNAIDSDLIQKASHIAATDFLKNANAVLSLIKK